MVLLRSILTNEYGVPLLQFDDHGDTSTDGHLTQVSTVLAMWILQIYSLFRLTACLLTFSVAILQWSRNASVATGHLPTRQQNGN
jgi:hypothetical protein